MAFRFPSVSSFLKEALGTFKRFSLPLLAAITGTVICMYMIDLKWDEQKKMLHLWKIVMACGLGLNLFLSMCLISERRKDGPALKYLIQLFGTLILVGYYYLLPPLNLMTIMHGAQFALFVIGLHLLVSFAPFIGKGEMNGFWQFNKTLFLRFLLSVLYTGVLYVGLVLALAAIDQLFNADIKGERYGQLVLFLAGIFNTWFFLTGIPKDMDELETVTDYPKGLKIFTQFVLLPLLALYLVILYAYGIKILIQWELPKGWVSWLVNAFSVFGILSLLLIWPIRNDEGNKWISTFSRWFYRALFPLIILLGVAIGKRVMQYGITENRYFVLLIAFWLLVIALYFLFSKSKNIKTIPVTLFLVSFLSSFGPWGAFSVSERSQVGRLEKLLTEEKILVDGKIKKATDSVAEKNGMQIASIVHYLDDHHGFETIKPWFREDLDTVLAPKDSTGYVNGAGEILALMGVGDNYYYYRDDEHEEEESENGTAFYYNTRNDNVKAVSVAGFDYSCNFNSYFPDVSNAPSFYENLIHFGNDSGTFKYRNDRKQYSFTKNGKEVLQFDLSGFVKKISDYNKGHKKHQNDRTIPNELMQFDAQNDSVRIRMFLNNISGKKLKGEINVTDISGMLLLRIGATQTDTLHGSTPGH